MPSGWHGKYVDPLRKPPSQQWSDAFGTASITRVSLCVVRIEMHGFLSPELGSKLAAVLEHYLEVSDVVVNLFWDSSNLRGYASSARVECTLAIRRHWSLVGQIHVLVRTRIVAMAAAVANLALEGRIASFWDREAFENEYRTALGLPLIHRRHVS